MKLRKSRISLAVGVVLGAAAMIPATSFGWSVFTNFSGLSTTSGGDTLLFPIYTTANTEIDGVLGRVTTNFSVINSGEHTVLAKIRFREQEKSMDVLDFLVIMSPHDNFAFYVGQQDDPATEAVEPPYMAWTDATCVVGPGSSADGVDEVKVDFPPPNTPFVTSVDQMSVGHLEVLGMATLDNVAVMGNEVVPVGTSGSVSFADAAKHGPDGKPADCALLVSWLANSDKVNTLNNANIPGPDGTTVQALGDVPNELSGRYLITGYEGNAQGIEGGSDAIGIRNSNLTWNPRDSRIQITSQSNADCEQVDYSNCLPIATQYAWATKEWDHPHLGEMYGLDWFQVNLGAHSILGDWSNNPANYVGVDWVLSFPSKYAYLDYVDASSCAGGADSGKEWCLLDATRTSVGWNPTPSHPHPYGIPGIWTGTTGSETSVGEATECLGVRDNDLYTYNREEAAADTTVTVSPGGRPTLDVCQELQVFTLAPVGTTPRASIIQTPQRRDVITFENLEALYGWAQMELAWPTRYADAMSGILFTTRATEDPVVNNGSITELQKKTTVFAPE
jgi:hypothetical protein